MSKQLAILTIYQSLFYDVMFSPDGTQLATSGDDGIVYLSDASGKQLVEITAHHGSDKTDSSVVFSPDGKQLATSGGDGTVRLWDTAGNQLALFTGHQGPVYNAVFSPNGKELVTRSLDGTARLWQVGGIDELYSRNCDWVGEYLVNNPKVAERDRHLCDGIGSRQ